LKKWFFEFLNQFAFLTIKYLPSYIACHDPLDPFFQTLGIWIQGSGAAGHVSSTTYFSNILEDKDRRFKANLTLSLILQFNLKLGGYSIWSTSLTAPHIQEDLTTTRKTPSRWSSGELEDAFRSTRKPAVLDYEELRGLSNSSPRDYAHGVHLIG
jgi:hypothetical protein